MNNILTFQKRAKKIIENAEFKTKKLKTVLKLNKAYPLSQLKFNLIQFKIKKNF